MRPSACFVAFAMFAGTRVNLTQATCTSAQLLTSNSTDVCGAACILLKEATLR